MAIPDEIDYQALRGIPETRARLNILTSRLSDFWSTDPAPGRLVEIGVGAGETTAALLTIFTHLLCVDIDEQRLVAAANGAQAAVGRRPDIHVGAAESLNLPPGSVDVFVLMNILEHLEDPVSVLGSLRGMMSADGRICITVPLANSLHRHLGVAMGYLDRVEALAESDRNFAHRRVYSPNLLQGHVEAAGYRVTFSRPLYIKPLPTKYMRDLPAPIHEGLDKMALAMPEFASYIYLEASPVIGSLP